MNENFKVQVNDDILTDDELSNRAFYLYIYLKLYGKSNETVYIYPPELLEQMGWTGNNTFKKYLLELKQLGYIDYELSINKQGNECLPINRRMIINFTDDLSEGSFTQIDFKTILKLQNVLKLTEIYKVDHESTADNKNKKYIIEKHYDEKEVGLRMYFLYEKFYNKKDQCGIPISYENISKTSKASPQIIAYVNNTLEKNNLLKIKHGIFWVKDRKIKNKYIPMWGNRNYKDEI